MLLFPFHGFCMAPADNVPGVSGGTVAFILGFYDRFINALHDLLGRDNTARKTALVYLLKLGTGWIIGMGLCISLLAGLFADHIYSMSSLFDLLMSKLMLLGSGGAIWLLAAGGMLCTKKYRRQGVTLLAGAVLGIAIGEAVYRAAGPRLRA